ncbi:MAG: MFS transporter [Chloroflexota bacterium]|nr:MFS transporter [Chloroflexota bacterium]
MPRASTTENKAAAAETTIRGAWPVLAVLCASQLVVVLNLQIVAVALPRIGEGLGVPPADLQWVISGYALAFGGFLLLGGRAADLFGHRRLFMVGLGVYALASLACGLAANPVTLIGARAFQGIGAALFVPATIALIADAFPAGAARDRALAVWAAAGPVGGILSVAIGGAVADVLGWRTVFLISVPVAVIPLALAPAVLAGHGRREAGRMDVSGAVAGTAAIVALVYALDHAARGGLTSGPVLAAVPIGIALLALFVAIERRAPSPLVPAALLRRGGVLSGSIVAFLHGASTNTPIVFFALYLQQVQGASLFATGIAFLPVNLALIAATILGPRILARMGFGLTMVAGMVAIVAGLLIQSLLSSAGAYATTLLPGLMIQGFGLGLALLGIVGAVTGGAAPAERGIAAGLMNTSAQIGTAIGLALLTAVFASRATAGTAEVSAVVAGVQWAFRAAAGLAMVGVIAAFLVVRSPRAAGSVAGQDQVPDPVTADRTLSDR